MKRKFPLYAILFFGITAAIILLTTAISPLESENSPVLRRVFKGSQQPSPQPTASTSKVPELEAEVIVSDLNHPWDMSMLADGSIIFTQRSNQINIWQDGEVFTLAEPEDTYVQGEGGMLGLALDPAFEQNNYIYTCFNSQQGDQLDVRLVRWVLDRENMTLIDRTDIVAGIPANSSGRHSGCQPVFGPDGYLWIGTGDAAQASNPQDPQSLGGKILRVDRNGEPAPNNLDEPFDPKIFSYGHRNTQGIGFFSADKQPDLLGVSIEHGPARDDELNPLVKGNFGWDPLPGYIETVPMTDTDKFPEAVEAIWTSGFPTLATSGGTVISGKQWGAWDQAVAMGGLRSERVIIIEIDSNLEVKSQTELFEGEYGRIRTVQQGIEGSLYLLTDNGSSDQIIKITPR
mgnify:CR=1 FL=1